MKEYKDKSWWLGATPYNENPPLTEDIEVDLCIIGGGFTGLSSAYYIKKKKPELSVAVLENEVVGYGASGRNGGFSMPLLGWNITYLVWAFGAERARPTHHFMLECVRRTKELVENEKIDCDLEYPGLMVLAHNNFQYRGLQRDYENYHKVGCDDVLLLDKTALKDRLNSAFHVGALYEPETAILNPAKLSRGMKDAVERMGVKVFERTPVESFEPGKEVIVHTPKARVKAKYVVLATNAFTVRLNINKNWFVPMFTYIILTEPLNDRQYQELGWVKREGIEDRRQLVHYLRLTADNRVAFGGRDAPYYYGNALEGKDSHQKIFDGLERDMKQFFPMLSQVKITHRWGGPVAITGFFVPKFSYYQDHRNIAYGMGYCGHGVALSTSAGLIIHDLLFEPDSELTKFLFVHNMEMTIPPEPLRWLFVHAVKDGLRLFDYVTEL